jgi:ATP phosphoribosyltransferase
VIEQLLLQIANNAKGVQKKELIGKLQATIKQCLDNVKNVTMSNNIEKKKRDEVDQIISRFEDSIPPGNFFFQNNHVKIQ